jgi:hypothetical protein
MIASLCHFYGHSASTRPREMHVVKRYVGEFLL